MYLRSSLSSTLLVILSTVITLTKCARILFLPAHIGTSHKRSMWAPAEAIAQAGHETQVFVPNVVDDRIKSKLSNLVDHVSVIDTDYLLLLEMFKFENNTEFKINLAWKSRGTRFWHIAAVWSLFTHVCEKFLAQQPDEFRKLSDPGQWDLLVIDPYFSPCGYAIAERSKAPFVLWSTTLTHITTLDSRAIPAPTSYVPTSAASEYFSSQRFWTRIENFFLDCLWRVVHYTIIERFLIRRSIADVYPSFTFDNSEKRALLSASMYPEIISSPSPRNPDLFYLPITCPALGQLPENYANFVNDPASKGTIVIAFGHFGGSWSIVPREHYVAFRDALRRLKDYRIIWQCDVVDKEENPAQSTPSGHLWKTKWLPQNELLNHPKTRLFVSHCGLKSVTEAVCAGVPIGAMPLFAEQYLNAGNVLRRGIGVFVDKMLLSEQYLYDILANALRDEALLRKVRHYKEITIDNILSSSQYTTYLLEHTIRQRERLHLTHSRGAYLPFWKFYNLDCAVFLLFCITAFNFLAVKFISIGATRLLDSRKKKNQNK